MNANGKGRNWIPAAFATLADDVALQIALHGGKVWLFNREGWTFHAKGVWISTTTQLDKMEIKASRDPMFNETDLLLACVIGSSNYGARSEDLDMESNCILVLDPSTTDTNSSTKECLLHTSLVNEWNLMCAHSQSLECQFKPDGVAKENSALKLTLPFIRLFL